MRYCIMCEEWIGGRKREWSMWCNERDHAAWTISSIDLQHGTARLLGVLDGKIYAVASFDCGERTSTEFYDEPIPF